MYIRKLGYLEAAWFKSPITSPKPLKNLCIVYYLNFGINGNTLKELVDGYSKDAQDVDFNVAQLYNTLYTRFAPNVHLMIMHSAGEGWFIERLLGWILKKMHERKYGHCPF